MLRLLLLLGCLVALWLVGNAFGLHDPILLFLAAAVVSVVLSFFVLRGPREAMTREVADRLAARTAGLPHGDEVDEDAEAEAEPQAQAHDEWAGEDEGSAEPEGEAGQDAEGQLAPPGVTQRRDESPAGG